MNDNDKEWILKVWLGFVLVMGAGALVVLSGVFR